MSRHHVVLHRPVYEIMQQEIHDLRALLGSMSGWVMAWDRRRKTGEEPIVTDEHIGNIARQVERQHNDARERHRREFARREPVPPDVIYPCPFCGQDGVLDGLRVRCSEAKYCGIVGPQGDNAQQAIVRWNVRTPLVTGTL